MFKVVDEFNMKVLATSLQGKYNKSDDYIPVLGSIVSLIVLFIISAGLHVAYVINTDATKTFADYYFKYSFNGFLWLFVSLTIFNIYQKFKGIGKRDRTNTKSIFWKVAGVWAIITGLIVGWCNSKTIVEFCGYFVNKSWLTVLALIKVIGSFIWMGLCWHDSFTNIPMSLIVLVIGGLAWLTSYISVKWSEYEYNKLTPTIRKQMVGERWLDIITSLYTFNNTDYINNNLCIWGDLYLNRATSQLSHAIIRDVVYKTYEKLFTKSKLENPISPNKEIFGLYLQNRIWFVKRQLNTKDTYKFIKMENTFDINLQLMLKNYKSEIVKLAAVLKKQDEDILKNKYDYTDNCIFRFVSRWNRKIKELVMDGIEQSGIFLSYMWLLLKAKKQKACPYFMFTDAPLKKTKK